MAQGMRWLLLASLLILAEAEGAGRADGEGGEAVIPASRWKGAPSVTGSDAGDPMVGRHWDLQGREPGFNGPEHQLKGGSDDYMRIARASGGLGMEDVLTQSMMHPVTPSHSMPMMNHPTMDRSMQHVWRSGHDHSETFSDAANLGFVPPELQSASWEVTESIFTNRHPAANFIPQPLTTSIHDGKRRSGEVIASCTSLCIFSMSFSGVLSRTGGSSCDDPSCGFLSFSRRGIKSIEKDTFKGMLHLRVLDLSNNQLQQVSSDDLRNLTSLETLALNNNVLTQIAAGTFDGLSSLTSLNLEYNNGLVTLEDGAFRGIPRLVTLKLSNHRLCVLRNGTFGGDLPNLENLYLDRTLVSSSSYPMSIEAGALFGLGSLKYLSLGYCYFSDENLLPGIFRQCRNLTILHLHSNRLTSIPRLTFVGLEESLEQVNLQNNWLTSVSGDSFSGFLKLRHIILYSNSISVLPLSVFANVTPGCTVDLRWNPMTCGPKGPAGVSISLPTSDLPVCPSEVRSSIPF